MMTAEVSTHAAILGPCVTLKRWHETPAGHAFDGRQSASAPIERGDVLGAAKRAHDAYAHAASHLGWPPPPPLEAIAWTHAEVPS